MLQLTAQSKEITFLKYTNINNWIAVGMLPVYIAHNFIGYIPTAGFKERKNGSTIELKLHFELPCTGKKQNKKTKFSLLFMLVSKERCIYNLFFIRNWTKASSKQHRV